MQRTCVRAHTAMHAYACIREDCMRTRMHARMRTHVHACVRICMHAYARTHVHARMRTHVQVLYQLSEILLSPFLIVDEWSELMAGVGSKMPQHCRDALQKLAPDPKADSAFGAEVLAVLEQSVANAESEGAAVALTQQAAPLFDFGTRFKGGLIDNATSVVRSFIEHFLAVEKFYPDDRSELLGVYNLTQANPDSLHAALIGVLSHFGIERKVSVMLTVLDLLGVYTHMDSSIHKVGPCTLHPAPCTHSPTPRLRAPPCEGRTSLWLSTGSSSMRSSATRRSRTSWSWPRG